MDPDERQIQINKQDNRALVKCFLIVFTFSVVAFVLGMGTILGYKWMGIHSDQVNKCQQVENK